MRAAPLFQLVTLPVASREKIAYSRMSSAASTLATCELVSSETSGGVLISWLPFRSITITPAFVRRSRYWDPCSDELPSLCRTARRDFVERVHRGAAYPRPRKCRWPSAEGRSTGLRKRCRAHGSVAMRKSATPTPDRQPVTADRGHRRCKR